MKIAIIDLGSNSARMTVWNCQGEKKEVLSNKRIYVRLSEGLSENNLLQEEPMTRALSALSVFSEILEKEKCDRVISVSTEALRRAENSDVFLKRAKKLGFDIKILSGDDEARYDFLAAENLIKGKSAFLLDVGGGSFELIRVDDGEMTGHICLPMGAVVMSDKFGSDSRALEEFFTETFNNLSLIKGAKDHVIICLGGSIRSLFAVSVGAKDGNTLTYEEFLKIYEKIVSTDAEALKKEAVFNDRFDIINAGLAPFYALSTLIDAKSFIVCNKGVREGILRECLKKN